MPGQVPSGGWGYLVPLIVLGLVVLRGLRTRTLRVERMWIMPALILLAVGMSLSNQAFPRPLLLLMDLAALAAGVAAGWWRGRTTAIAVDPQTHAVTSKASPVGLALIAGLFLVRFVLRDYAADHAAQLHVRPMEIAEPFLLLAAGLVCAQRLEMWLRASRMLAAARAS